MKKSNIFSGPLFSFRNSFLATTVALVLGALVLAPAASAQVPGGQCNGSGAIAGTFSLSPNSGPAGSTTTVTGDLPAPDAVPGASDHASDRASTDVMQPGFAASSTTATIFWLEAGSSGGVQVGVFPVTINPDFTSHFSGQIVVPANSAPAPHEVAIWITGATAPDCLTFTVTPSVRQAAYTQTKSLPDTGSMLLIPAAGLAAAGAGALVLTRRVRNPSD